MTLSVDDYIAKRGLSKEAIAEKERELQDRIEAYELAEIRKEAGLTQVQLAKSMGISQTRVSEIEHGRTGSIRVDTLQRYAAALGGKLLVEIEIPTPDGGCKLLNVPVGTC